MHKMLQKHKMHKMLQMFQHEMFRMLQHQKLRMFLRTRVQPPLLRVPPHLPRSATSQSQKDQPHPCKKWRGTKSTSWATRSSPPKPSPRRGSRKARLSTLSSGRDG